MAEVTPDGQIVPTVIPQTWEEEVEKAMAALDPTHSMGVPTDTCDSLDVVPADDNWMEREALAAQYEPLVHAREEPLPDQQRIASRILMKVLYGACFVRFDVLHCVCRLACRITTWDSECDLALHRLIGYLNSTADYRLVCWMGQHS